MDVLDAQRWHRGRDAKASAGTGQRRRAGRHVLARRTRSGRDAARAMALLLVLLTTSLSGCLGMESLFEPRPLPVKIAEPAIVRVWLATTLGGLTDEFAHANVSLAGTALRLSVRDEEMEVMQPVKRQVDLVALQKDRKAVQIGQITTKPLDYYGVLLSISEVEVGIRTLVGQRDGEPVYRVDPQPASFNGVPSRLTLPITTFDGMVTDVYLEYDLPSTIKSADGTHTYAHGFYGASVFVNRVKVRDVTFASPAMQESIAERDDPSEPAARRSSYPAPSVEIDGVNQHGDNVLAPLHPHGHVRRALARDEVLHLSAKVPSYTKNNLVQATWDFGDGTQAQGLEVTKRWDHGGVYDVVVIVRDDRDRIARDVITFFVPYAADEAMDDRRDHRTGRWVVAAGETGSADVLAKAHESFSFQREKEAWRLAGYRIVLDHQVSGDDTGALTSRVDATLNVTSGHVHAVKNGTGRIVIETAGVPTARGVMQDWVEERLDVRFSFTPGVVVDYQLEVTALYYPSLLHGRDPHGNHLHGPWHWSEPYFHHLDHRGTLIQRDSDEGLGLPDPGGVLPPMPPLPPVP